MKIGLLREEHGAAAVEFAMIVTLLLTFVFGIIEFGILMYDKHILTNASREGARVGIVMRIPRVSDNEITTVVDNYAKKYMVTFGTPNNPVFPDPILPLESSRTGAMFGKELIVKVEYDYDFLFLSFVGLGPIRLKAETRMRME